MDKKSIIGIFLIFATLVIFSLLNQPSKEKIEAAKRKRDSLMLVEAENIRKIEETRKQDSINQMNLKTDTVSKDMLVQQQVSLLGSFGNSAVGKEEFYTIENNLLKLTISNKGGKVYSVQLKEYQTHDSLPLILFEGPNTHFGLNFFAQNRSIQTDQLFFTTTARQSVVVSGPSVKEGDWGNEKFNRDHKGGEESVVFRLEAEPGRYLEYTYKLKHNSYMVDFKIITVGLDKLIASNQSYLNLNWSFDLNRQEVISKFGEDRYTNIFYKFYEDDVESLPQGKPKELNLSTRTKWISFKQLFFNSTIISSEFFPSAIVRSEPKPEDLRYLARHSADISLPYENKSSENYSMQFYFGPNHYQTLRQYKIELERLVYLGYAIVRPVNKYLIIPVFNFLRDYMTNFGIIILLLTIFIKTILFPFTYKSYLSQAKMKALKPEVDELTKKFGNDKPMEKQQATMALYKKAGVNPMGGCLPMLLQFPILIAMFFFFPTSIELRQESFLWAHDLSTYDSIMKLPFTIPFYGNHVSLFCLLMTITTIISTHLSQQATSSQSMPGMKTMMYMMPVFFMFLLNSYSAGLSYYYFLANVFTIGQTYIIRRFVDEEKIRAQLQVNKKKPVQKSKFQQRLEKIAKDRGIQLPK